MATIADGKPVVMVAGHTPLESFWYAELAVSDNGAPEEMLVELFYVSSGARGFFVRVLFP